MQNYSGDGEEEKETLMNFSADELLTDGPANPEDEWVATHTGSNCK
jgi:hypothetical protein